MNNLTEIQKKEVLSQKISADLSLLVETCKVLEVCTKRGTFEATELTYVGSLYDIFNNAVMSAINNKLEEGSAKDVERNDGTLDPLVEIKEGTNLLSEIKKKLEEDKKVSEIKKRVRGN